MLIFMSTGIVFTLCNDSMERTDPRDVRGVCDAGPYRYVELRGGRALVVRDTLTAIRRQLERWGYALNAADWRSPGVYDVEPRQLALV